MIAKSDQYRIKSEVQLDAENLIGAPDTIWENLRFSGGEYGGMEFRRQALGSTYLLPNIVNLLSCVEIWV